MKHKTPAILFVLLTFLCSCDFNSCDDDIESLISEAPSALAEFKLVKQEVLSNQEFVRDFSINGSLFLSPSNIDKYAAYSLPNLQKWFENDMGYISFESEDTSFCYRTCQDGLNTVSAYVYYKNMKDDYKLSVDIIDSMKLEGNWFAHVVKCFGCND